MNILQLIHKVWKWKWVLRSIFSTVYFNLHYLPLRQAIRLPILLYKPHLKKMKGTVKITGGVKFGMIQLGKDFVAIYPDSGIVYENNGGNIVFNGRMYAGSASAISVGPGARLTLGADVCASAALKLVCYKSITLHDRVRFGWDVTMFDCDFHKLTLLGGGYTNPYRSIEIGENCWLGYGCTVLKGTILPPYTTVSAKTVLCKKYDIPQYCVIGMENTVRIKKEGIYRNLDDDSIYDL